MLFLLWLKGVLLRWLSLGRLFGASKFLGGLLLLYGVRPAVRFLRVIILWDKGMIWPRGVVCVSVTVKWWNGETVDHLLLHCPRASVLWNFVFHSFAIQRVLPWIGWQNWLGKHSSEVWNLVPLCWIWIVWRKRNRHTFEDLESSKSQTLEFFATSLFDWLHAWGFTTSSSVVTFIASLWISHSTL